MSKKSAKHPPLLYAASAHNADQLYFTGFSVPDPFIAFKDGRRKVAALNALEFARGRKESDLDEVLELEPWLEQATRCFRHRRPGPAEVIATIARDRKIGGFTIAPDFPAGVALRLMELGIKIDVADGPLFPSREIKTDEQAAAIREGCRCSAAGIRAAETMLRAAQIRRGRLYHGGRVLTSERVKEAVEIACLKAGATSTDTIVAGGDQACDPHCRGSGPLRAGELIIVDVFPRVHATHYHGDMTRTFLRGEASDEQRRLVAAVRAAQREALQKIRSGADGRAVHQAAELCFVRRGFMTSRNSDGPRGFFHGTGHGLGLDVHEPPRISPSGSRLKKGHVVTVEPGLYYPGLGACRIEDVVRVTSGAPEMLSRYPYRWELR